MFVVMQSSLVFILNPASLLIFSGMTSQYKCTYEGGAEHDLSPEVVTLSYNDLFGYSSTCSTEVQIRCEKAIRKAFGNRDSLGIICIVDVPKMSTRSYQKLRKTLLPLGNSLAINSNKGILADVVVPEAFYSVGWSHGKEKLSKNKYDLSKGSYYANPLVDDHAADDRIKQNIRKYLSNSQLKTAIVDDSSVKKFIEENAAYFASNVWPQDDSFKDLEPSFKSMGQFLHSVGIELAKLIDGYVRTVDPTYDNHIQKVLTTSSYSKGRLLHYFANTHKADLPIRIENTADRIDGWCGWHNDHGSLTALVPAIYLDSAGNEIQCPDENAGLYIMSRNGVPTHIKMPGDSIGFQVGETSQVHTGGIIRATPHCVRQCCDGVGEPVTRETFACFFEPEFDGDMRVHANSRTMYDIQSVEAIEALPKGVSSIKQRLVDGMNFGEFSEATIKQFNS